ncbi:MAG: hypothetical protein IJ165_00070 [Proteobacteria bacterium]|nr:hypothetical protein [Pseudomonadota bacterium]
MTQPSSEKSMLSGIGKFGTLSELLKRGLNVQVTFGNTSAVDKITIGTINRLEIQVIYPDGTEKRIKVKTSRTERFVTQWQKYRDNTDRQPDYWVIVHIDENNISHYHILTHEELGALSARRAGCSPEEMGSEGVDNVLLEHIAESENRWDKILECQ